MIRTRQLLQAFPLVHTSNVDELERSLGTVIARPTLEFVSRDNKLDAVHNFLKLERIGISYGTYGTDIRLKFPESTIFAQIFPLGGTAEIQGEGKSTVTDLDHSAVISPDAGFTLTSSAEYERLNLCIDSVALDNLLSAMIGKTMNSPLKMDPVPKSTILTGSLRDHVFFLARQACTAPTPPPLLLAEFEQALMMMFLHVNRHNYSHLLEQEPADAAPWQVRHAEEYIEANWNKPIRFEAIAATIGVSVPSLFATYRQSRGYSPMVFLRETRLRHARQMLQQPESSTTVAGVAFACGFGNYSRFERDYLRTFGDHPSQTLSHNKGDMDL